MTTPLLTVNQLSKTFLRRGEAVRAVDNVSFNLHAGETWALVGESGSGKSTTGRLVLGLTPATAGDVVFEGRSLMGLNAAGWRSVRRDMQMIFQDPLSSLDPRRRIGYSLEEPLIIHGIDKRKIRVAEMLEQVGLRPQDAARYPHEFSGGQRQRIGIARALILKPKLIVCDEPVSALDVSIQSQILNLLMALQREYGLAYLFISHDLNVVRHIADRVGVMYRGKIVEQGETERIFTHAGHDYTRYLLNAILPAYPAAAGGRRALANG
ncbi:MULTISPECIES: ABC transporter ATP-binding protein [Raoultella]|uniref:ATP-binding cassette domain-containing protein n=1 Tax=Raoultella planticola TaxID=575 RepID=A0ABU5M4U9_RAOPL|nr:MULTISPECIES: ATP-binding cassette domain-containing protein [Raoultella]MCE9856203.1 ATP-binding cassette domain-containing protein [Raoultella planticola]MDM9676493.1 ATP-binding cassette domain-containing protein [Raoultella planticola]MDW4555373.1 ATP-binding cassette domain-containing protein [Raoultella planticola]MDZ7446119.1 ATP-binding cassette domain-containing protein [Raoultella planticola]MDZ7466956.1 ATP-binding cassette domain-containing protein [Raoultella planticola]